ncbi:hypothetical protein M569_08055 [Genlisea aurea]|uniref:Cupin type-1 domain-containing protein n=1 Tax=Genlisea aurea TaxID=192259 RepID=S8CI53_9LAMI|nr:hypothetical protein M569_08055 [Genlisea aurea]
MPERALLLLLAAALMAAPAVNSAAGRGYDEEGRRRHWDEEEGRGYDEEGRRRWGEGEEFLLRDAQRVVRTEAGEMKVVTGFGGGGGVRNPIHVGFITMEPSSFFVPQYLDSSLILFIRRGEVTVGHIYKDELVERNLKTGDVYRIAAGSTFYLINAAEGQRLHVVCGITTSESFGWHPFQPFYIGGGRNPVSVLSGFDPLTLSTAFNVSEAELVDFLTMQEKGPIVYYSESESESRPWSAFVKMDKHRKLAELRTAAEDDIAEEILEDQSTWWSLKNLLNSFLNKKRGGGRRTGSSKAPDAYNLYDRKPDFRNNYGWSVALYESDYKPLRHEDVGVYLVNLTAGSMMAPHFNRKATEYGVVLYGSGRIQIVRPNGSLAMDAEVEEGDVFWIPRYFPFCQIASRTGAFEFFGFTTSARNNRPQFLAGAGSVLRAMRGPELAAAFGVSQERLDQIIDAQEETTILPSATVAPPA